MRLLVFLFFIIVSLQSEKQDCKPFLTREYVDIIDLVATGYTDMEMKATDDKVAFMLDSVFRGGEESIIRVDMKRSDFLLKSGTWYLIYATRESSGEYSLSKCSRTAEYTEAFDDIKFLSRNVECVDKSLMHNRACFRNLSNICGCDGKTYGNLCEAHRSGIAVYSVGRCKDQ